VKLTGATLADQTNALLDLLQRQGSRLLALFTRLTLRADVAEDLLQELFLRLHGSTPFAAAHDIDAYAMRTAVHLAFDWRRQERRRRESTGLKADILPAPDSAVCGIVQREELEPVLQALECLSPLMQSCVVFRYLQQESYEQIGARLERTPHQARALCHKGLSELRRLLGASTATSGGISDEHIA
jgi:RNA polymerase sigma factor (sigma-70 family)